MLKQGLINILNGKSPVRVLTFVRKSLWCCTGALEGTQLVNVEFDTSLPGDAYAPLSLWWCLARGKGACQGHQKESIHVHQGQKDDLCVHQGFALRAARM